MSEMAGMEGIILNMRSKQKDSAFRCRAIWLGVLGLILLVSVPTWAQDPGWPRQITKPNGVFVYYQPQVDDWKDFTELSWRMAFTFTPTGGKQIVGVLEMQGHTNVDNDKKMVYITDLKINNINFPSLDAATAAKMEERAKALLPPSVTISLQRLVACVKKPEAVAGVPVNNDPPAIIVTYTPAILLSVDGQPSLADVPKTNLKFVVNTTWPLFFDKSASAYYLLIGQQWATAKSLDGPWMPTLKLPKDMTKVAEDPQWAALKKVVPPPSGANQPLPAIFYSNKPAEIILFDGKPVYSKIPGTQLVYSTNTQSYVFLESSTNQFYYLTGGRWFRANSLQGPWTFATMDLPADFANIPSSSPASVVLASVPGTDEAKDAVLLAQIPTTMTVNTATAAAQVKVNYGGEPKFEPITGTTLYYATNTQEKVIKVGDVFYLCLQGVWFMSTSPQGPWTVASSIPQVIYTIPPTSPVYNVTYVTQTTVSSGTVQSSYTAGYMGAFIIGATVGAVIASGSGYYYPPYIYYPAFGYPVYYHPPYTYGYYGVHYNTYTGAYGVSQTVYGPYGSATRAASYNPYTGTSARGATVSTPYGSRTAAQAYNPYTGTYAATRQGSSPTAQWGSSVVTNGNNTAYAQHYSTAQGTVGSVQTSQGGKAAGASTINGNTAAGKTANGDMYAGHDGNVYKNTGSGWQKYDNGSWNSVTPPANQQKTQGTQQPTTATQGANSTNQAAAQQKAQNYKQQPTTAQANSSTNQAAAQQREQTAQQQRSTSSEPGNSNRPNTGSSSQVQSLQQESQNRERGAQQTQRFQQSGGGGRSWGGGGGGGRRRP